MKTIIMKGNELLERGEGFVLASVLETQGSTPRKKGAVMMLTKQGEFFGTVGGGKLEAECQRISREAMESRISGTVNFSLTPKEQQGLDMRCGGDASVRIDYIDPLHPEEFRKLQAQKERALIFGGGHIGLALEKLLRFVDFETVVLDDREEFANRERFPEASEVRVIPSYPSAYEGLEAGEDAYAVIVTRGHQGDHDVLREALKRPHAYIGMIGSRNKIRTVFDLLKEEGFPEESLEKVCAPVGLKIGAETPEEIAVSIAGEMIEKRAKNGK